MSGLRETVWLIVCEPEPRWTPTLKAVLANDVSDSVVFRVLPIRERPTPVSLGEIEQPALLLTQIGTTDFASSLSWVRRARRAETVEVVALLDRRLNEQGATGLNADERAVAAIHEAGAIRVLRSTLELAGVPALARRHAERVAEQLDASASPRAAVWRRLPWQRAPTSLR